MNQAEQVRARVAERRDDIIQFMRDICAIPSMNSEIGPVGERIQQEMTQAAEASRAAAAESGAAKAESAAAAAETPPPSTETESPKEDA